MKKGATEPLKIPAPLQVIDLESGRVLLEVGIRDNAAYLTLNAPSGPVLELTASDEHGGHVLVRNARGHDLVDVGTHSHGGRVVVREASSDPDGANASLYVERGYADVTLAADGARFNRIAVGEVL